MSERVASPRRFIGHDQLCALLGEATTVAQPIRVSGVTP